MKSQNKIILYFIALSTIFIPGCEQSYVPKPRAFFRIDLPKKEYKQLETPCPFTFEYPVYAKVLPDIRPETESCWMNIDFPQFKARIHLSYKRLNNDVAKYLEDSRTLTYKHIAKATDIRENVFVNDTNRTYGLIYDIEGDAASNLQFYVTDSTRHFVRGALYFNAPPNQDSLSPVLNFIKKDVYQMMETFQWK